MAISLKEQLTQVNQLQEVMYHAPVFDKHYYDKNDHSEGRKNGQKMFYDFYAMEFMWSFLGSGQIPKAEREKMAMMDPDDPRRDIYPKTHRFIPEAGVKVIDSMYEQVTNTVAKNLLAYIRLAVVQEFQYLVTYSSGWTYFRNEITSKYNMAKQKGVPFTKKDFDAIVDKHIPDMKPYPESIKRLLKYSKYFSEMNTTDDQDPFDVSRTFAGPATSEEPLELPSGPAPAVDEPAASASEPDDTDYNAEPVKRDFGKYGGPGQPAAPYPSDFSGHSAFKDAGEPPKIPADDEDDDEEVKERLTEEVVNPKKIKKVYAAINKSGVTLDDIEKAYNNVPWGGSYGGPKWGAGAVALLKLTHAKKKLSTEDMNHIIDHIYDLQHNTGSLLNKGPMFIDDTDLNRRYKITDVARFLPFVSPSVKNIILRFYKYLVNDPNKVALEANMETLLRSPKLPLSPEEVTQLSTLGFKVAGDNSYRVGIRFNNKKGESVHGVYYQVSKHDVGTFNEKGVFVKTPEANPIYIVSDNLKADVKAFPAFEQAFSYVSSYKNDMNPHANVGGHTPSYTPAPTIKSEKQMYIDSHTKIKLPPDKEQVLLNIQIGWRTKGKMYYKAYFPGDARLNFYAFSDGSFLMHRTDKSDYFVYPEWTAALAAAKTMTKGAQEYPEKADAQAAIDAALSGKSPGKANTPVSDVKDYYLPAVELAHLTTLVNTLPQFTHEKYILGTTNDGMTVVSKAKYHDTKAKFAVGKHLDSAVKPYKVVHFLGTGPKESWVFPTWNIAYDFVEKNLSKLVNAGLAVALPIAQQATPSASVTPSAYASPSGKPLPPNSAFQAAYKAHVGISNPPKNTIRLTEPDEAKLKLVGFEPRMVGDDVWYIHKGTGDSAKFYPNDQAKIMFASKSAGKQLAAVNGTIEKMLTWLTDGKYSATMSQSPIKQKGASAITPATTTALGGTVPVAPTPGIKAGTMFEKIFTDAGFVWDDMGQDYVDYPTKTPGEASNVLKIAPDRSSVLTMVDGSQRSFKDLPSLVAYIKNEYPAQKKSSSLTAASDKIKVYPSWMPTKMLELLEKGQYKYFGAHNGTSYGYENAVGDQIVIDPNTHVSQVKDSKTPGYVEPYNTLEEVIEYLQEKFGSTNTTPSNSKTGVNLLDIKLKDYGFEYAGPTDDGGNGTKKKGVVFDDPKKNRVIYYMDGNSIIYVNDPVSPKYNASTLLGDVYSLLKTLDEFFGQKPPPNNLHTTILPSAYQHLLKKAGFVEGKNKDGQPCYNHGHDFMFEIRWPNGKNAAIRWATEHGVKEHTPSAIEVFLEVLNSITPEMSGEAVDQWFSEQASGPDDTLEPSGELYKVHDDATFAHLIMLDIHDSALLRNCGFKFVPQENQYYKNPQGSTFSFYDTGTSIFYDAENGETVPFNNIPHALKFAVAKYVSQEDEPSNKKDTDERMLEELGFVKQTPHSMTGWFGNQVLGVYHNKKTNQLIQVVKSEHATLYKKGRSSWIPLLTQVPLKEVIAYLKQEGVDANKANPAPSSMENYNTMGNGQPLKPISLNLYDSELLEKIGFKWNSKEKAYIKLLHSNDTPALEEAGKKKKAKVDKDPIQQFELPLDPNLDPKGDNKHYEVINTWNSGWANWRWGKNPDGGKKTIIETTTLPIKGVLDFVWHRWSGYEKSPTKSKPHTKAGLSEKITLKLKRLGFRWDEDNQQYVKRPNSVEQEKIVVEDEELVLYYLDDNGYAKRYKSTSAQPIINKITAIQYNAAVKRLHKIGYVDLEKSMGPTPMVMAKSVKLFSEMYNENSRELLQIFSDGSVRYGLIAKPGDISSFVSYSMFDSLEDAADYLAPKNSKFVHLTGQTGQAPGPFHKSLVENFGFTFKDGKYSKGNQRISLDAGGIVNYNYIGRKGVMVTYAQHWKEPDGLNNLFLRVEANNPTGKNPTPPEVITTRVQASPETHEVLSQLSYLWDGHNLEYFNTNDYSKRIIFTSDGKIYYYPNSVAGDNLMFTSEKELLAKIKAKGKLLPVVSDILEVSIKKRLEQYGFVQLGNNPHVAKFKNATTSHLVILDMDDGDSVLYVYDHDANGMMPSKEFKTLEELFAEYPEKTNNLQENYYKTLMQAMYQ